MKLSTLFNGVQWVNVLTMLAQLLNMATQTWPDNKYTTAIVAVQGIIAAVLPSLNGMAHKAAFGEAQNPVQR